MRNAAIFHSNIGHYYLAKGNLAEAIKYSVMAFEEAEKREDIDLMVPITAHALSPENTLKSYNEGAVLYVPKDIIKHISTYLEDVLEAKQKGKNFWWRWFDRFAEFYNTKFGPEWQLSKKERNYGAESKGR